MLQLGLSQTLFAAGPRGESRVVKAIFLPAMCEWDQCDGDRIRTEATTLYRHLPVVLQEETGPCHNRWITRRRIDTPDELFRFLHGLDGYDPPYDLKSVCQRLCPISAVAEQDRHPAAIV